ncbi:translocation/assembly module TamB domain-containing protein [uncultured Pontibacter sp.]|uniref:translocation/assembly module TamB domain-containing protein n=1 Tax=uncultured Pontibacter sp. TaxID=453356 RepID=UPI00260D21A3|nr:translocation/assembly module TamB domain-containing protein [uncultured Pontibacter sp.]
MLQLLIQKREYAVCIFYQYQTAVKTCFKQFWSVQIFFIAYPCISFSVKQSTNLNPATIASAKHIAKIALKVILWPLAIIVGLLILIIIALQFQGVQNYLARQGENYLQNTLGTEVNIGGFTTDWRNALVLKEVYVEDQQQDTLWYSERLGVDMAILSLIKGEINISKVDLDNATLKLHIREDSTTNFDFITEAFATDTAAAQPADTASSAMQITLGTVNLENVYVVFQDEAGGNFIRTRVGDLTTTMEELNLEEQRYMVDEIRLANTWVDYEQTKLPPPDTSAYEPLEMDFGLNRVALENLRVKYLSRPAEQQIELALGESELVADHIDLKNARIELSTFDLHHTDLKYIQEKYKPTDSLAVNPARTAEELDESVEQANGQTVDWVLTLGEIDVTGLNVAFDNFNTPKQPRGMDYNHLNFKDIVLDAEDIKYSLNRSEVNLNQLTLQEQSGFAIQNFEGQIVVDSTSASLTNLDLKTGHSHLQNQLAMTYPSLEAIAENPEQVGLDVDISNSYIGMQDVLYFMPDMAENPSFRSIANSNIRVTARAEGQLDNLRIQTLQLSGLSNTQVDVSGTVRNAMDPDNLYMDLDIDRFATTRTDVQALVPAGTIPPNFRLPSQMSMTGNYQGTLAAFDANADLRTSFGNMVAKVDMGANESFTATVRSGGFDLNQLMTDSLGLGKIALEAEARGTGLTPETMQADVTANLKVFDYNNYTYNDIRLNANVNRNLYTVEATAKDQNLAFDLVGKFNLRDTTQPAYTFNLDLAKADLQALNLYPEPMAVRGQLQGDFTGADASTLSGRLAAQELKVQHNGTTYPVDSLLMTLAQRGETAEIMVQSDVVDADMRFRNSLATLPTALQKHFSNYLDLQPDPPFPANLSLDDFTATIDLKQTGLITSFVPGLEQLQPATPITATYNGDNQQLALNGRISKIVYTDYTLHNIDLAVRGDRNQLAYDLNLQKLLSPSLTADNIRIDGAARDNELAVRLTIAGDSTQQDERLVLGGVLNSMNRGYRFSLNPDQLVINGDDWDVPQDNYLQFDTNLLYANNIRLAYGNQAIILNSTGPVAPNAPLTANFENVDIGYLMRTIQEPQDSLIAGTINGTATVRNIMTDNLAFTSDLTISDFAYEGVPVGNLALQASSGTNNRYNIDARLTGNSNQVVINGFMEPQPNATLLNLNANINNLNMASLEGFMAGMVTQLDGSATGDLRIAGTLEQPNIQGQLNFNQAQFNITMLGSLFTLQNEQLEFNEQGIRFPNFTITDSLGNDMVINGNILTETYTDFEFGLEVDTERFLALNSTAQDNSLFYGTVYVNANASITGDMAQPAIKVNARVLDGSEFTTVIPADQVGAAERDGIVEFVNLNPQMTRVIRAEQEDSTEVTGFVGADIEAQITVTDATPITIIIDPITGDQLTVRGSADPLFIGMRPSGEINMSGRFTVSDGKYSMDFYDLASRELDIAEGSYINWTGDPLQAIMDITAIYNVETAPQELVASQAAGTLTPDLQNQVPFQVYVFVRGEILTPEISFDIRLPEEEQGSVPPMVVSSLGNLRQDESELNKQVFSLLVLNRFMAPDPLTSSGGGFESTARNSLGQVMTDQLNQLTNRYAGGLGLELGVDSYQDYSSGSAEGRTDLNVAMRQQFLNDRLTVRVGTDIGLEGGSQSNQTMSGFGGDISVEYSLTEDGRLRVRGFQRNQYEGFIEGGDVRATGVSLIYVREYNNFSDLFRDLEGRRRREEERRIEAAREFREEEKELKEEEKLQEEGTE